MAEQFKHRHVASCWTYVQKCGKREHKQHTGNCPKNAKGKYTCAGLHIHTTRCLRKKLECRVYGSMKGKKK